MVEWVSGVNTALRACLAEAVRAAREDVEDDGARAVHVGRQSRAEGLAALVAALHAVCEITSGNPGCTDRVILIIMVAKGFRNRLRRDS